MGQSRRDDVTALRGTTIHAVNGAQLFIANCATCHNWTGQGVGASAPGAYPSLIHNSAVGASDANNLAMVILHGVSRTTKQADVLMPAFGTQLTDDQVAAITQLCDQTVRQSAVDRDGRSGRQAAHAAIMTTRRRVSR